MYTVPGQVRYNATRKVVLKGADAVVFVADSQEDMRDQNIESFDNMRENLVSNNINPDTIPVILQFNKRDLNNIMGIEALNRDLNRNGTYEVLEAVAIDGKGVEETFKKITKLLLKDISRKHKIEIQPPEEKKKTALPVAPVPAANPEPVNQDIFPEQKAFSAPFSGQEIPQMSVLQSSAKLTNDEEIARVPEQKIHESEPVETIESVPVSAVPEPVPDAVPALPAFNEESMIPEYEIDDAELIEELESVTALDAPQAIPDAAPELPNDTGRTIVSEQELQESGPVGTVEPVTVNAIPEPVSVVVPSYPDFAEKTAIPEPEGPVEQPIPIFPEPSETESAREIPRDAARPFPADKSHELSDSVRELSKKMASMTETITLLRHTVSDLRTEVKALQYNIMPKKEQGEKVPDFRNSNEFKELKREQTEIAGLIRHLVYMLNSVKEKKSWFRFF